MSGCAGAGNAWLPGMVALVEGWVASMKGTPPTNSIEVDRVTEQRVTLLDQLLSAYQDPAA